MADEHVEPVEAIELSSDSESEVKTTNINLKPLEGATSVIWKFFSFEANQDRRILVADKREVTCI